MFTVGMAGIDAVGIYIQYWWPEIPTRASAALFFVLINLINTVNVRLYGETEFWFAIKVGDCRHDRVRRTAVGQRQQRLRPASPGSRAAMPHGSPGW